MRRLILATLAATVVLPLLAGSASGQQAVSPAQAQPPPPPPRAKGPALAFALQVAQAAAAACADKGYKVTVLVADSAGDPVVLLSGDGASLLSQRFARIKVATVLKYRLSSGEVAAKAKLDPKLDAEIKADPNLGRALPGAVPLLKGGELLGAIAVSGAAGGEMDLACVQAALLKVP